MLPTAEVINLLEEEFPIYWARIFKIMPKELILPNGMRVRQDNREQAEQLKQEMRKWEKEIEKYSEEAKQMLALSLFEESNDERYDAEEFKREVFAKGLWTVKSALTTPDPDLDQYKSRFHSTTAKDIFVAVHNILRGAMDYVERVTSSIAFTRISAPEQLKLQFLEEDGMLLKGVIGLGIRSEILHRLYPGSFAMMTRRNGWGMFFLTKDGGEFVVDEDKDGRHRTVFNWDYDYERFSFYSNFLASMIEAELRKIGLKMRPELRFAYVNQFLAAVTKVNKDRVSELNRRKSR